MSNRNFNRKQTLEHEIKDIYGEFSYTALVQAAGTLNLADDIVLTKVAGGAANNGYTFTSQVLAAAANPTNTVLASFTGTAAAIVATITPNDGTNNPTTAATASLAVSTPIVLTDNPNTGVLRNTTTFTTEVLAAAANPTDTVLVAFTGTAAAIVCTVTPNDGTNNGATPVDLTTAELVELINSGVVVGKTITLTDASSRRVLQTATGGDATAMANSGEGDSVVATFSGGANTAVTLTTAEFRELITSGTVSGKSVTVTDLGALRNDQTATGGGAAPMVDSGEGDGVVATFAGGVNQAFTTISKWGISSISETGTGVYRIVMEDKYAALKFVDVMVMATSASDKIFQIKAQDINGVSPYIDILASTAGSASNLSTGNVIKIVIEVKNTSII